MRRPNSIAARLNNPPAQTRQPCLDAAGVVSAAMPSTGDGRLVLRLNAGERNSDS